jgi:hypothetical protein
MWRSVLHSGVYCIALFAAAISPAQVPPTINMISPTNMARFPLVGSIPIFAEVSDPDGYVQVVQFFSGTNLIGASQEPPFSFVWNNPPEGHHRLSAVAMDNSGRRGFSQYVYVKVGTAPSAPSLVRGPYLQLGTPTNVIVRWRTDWPVDSKATYGAEPDSLDYTVSDSTLKAEHELRLTNLLSAIKYYYSIGISTQTFSDDEPYYFHTAPLGNQPTRIWIIGDSGTANQNAVNVRVDYEAFTGATPTDVWLMLGDNAYEEGTDDEYQRAVFEMYRRMLRQTVLWPTLGNHDTVFRGRSGEFPYIDMFTLPQNGEAGGLPSGTEKYYSFDYANIHFICLDSQTQSRKPGSAMLRWLEEDLAATAQDWIIAYWHHPPYTRGTYDSDVVRELVEMRSYAVPLLEQYGVDLVFAGHSHVYERSYLLNGHFGVADELAPEMILNSGYGRENNDGAFEKPAGGLGAGQGAVYIVCGCSGEGGATHEFSHPAMRVSSGGFGSVVLDVNGLRLDAKFLRVPGEVHDYFTIIKGTPSPGVRPALHVERATNLVQISWPTSLSPFTLQKTDNIGTEDEWSSVPELPFQFGRRNILRLPITATNEFFRLRAE